VGWNAGCAMQTFEYEALDNQGRNRNGFISAESAQSARDKLQEKQLLPVKVKTATSEKPNSSRSLSSKLSHRDITLFTRQMSTMVGASAPIEEALATIAQQTEKPPLKKMILAIRGSVAEGYTLSEAMAQHKKNFNQLYLAVVAAGEKSGALPVVLERLADHQERANQIRSKIQTALIYPACLAVTALLVIVALLTFVVPKVVAQFESINQKLPFITQLMINLSEGLQAYGLFLAGAILVLIVAFIRAYKVHSFRKVVDYFLLRLPIIGSVSRGLNASRLARTLATLLSSGVPVLEGLKASRKTVTNSVLQQTIDKIITNVEMGSSLSAALKTSKGFPPMVTYMTVAGENSGQLDAMLDKAASYMENEFESLIAVVLNLLEPAIILLMGGVVATIVLSIMLPIMQLNTLAGL